jgi:hypothetical protein
LVELGAGGNAEKKWRRKNRQKIDPASLCDAAKLKDLQMPNAEKSPRELLPVASNEERSMPDARRNVAGCTKGQEECTETRALYGRGIKANMTWPMLGLAVC